MENSQGETLHVVALQWDSRATLCPIRSILQALEHFQTLREPLGSEQDKSGKLPCPIQVAPLLGKP